MLAKVHIITGSLAVSPECWNLEFQPVDIFADNFLMFAGSFYTFASKIVISVNKHIKTAGF